MNATNAKGGGSVEGNTHKTTNVKTTKCESHTAKKCERENVKTTTPPMGMGRGRGRPSEGLRVDVLAHAAPEGELEGNEAQGAEEVEPPGQEEEGPQEQLRGARPAPYTQWGTVRHNDSIAY